MNIIPYAHATGTHGLTIRQEASLRIFCALSIGSTYSAELRAKRAWEMADLWIKNEPTSELEKE